MIRLSFFMLSLCAAAAAHADVEKRGAPDGLAAQQAQEIALKNQPRTVPVRAPRDIRATVSYTGDTTGGPTYQRAVASCAGLTATTGPMAYSLQPFTVDTSGAYDISSIQDGEFDGFVFLYEGDFDPANPLDGCVTGNDDGDDGIGTSDIDGAALTAGTDYLVVTTGFSAVDVGTFTNTIDGPGEITLGVVISADLSVVKSSPGGVSADAPFTYTFSAANAGPDPATEVAVTDILPAQVTFVDSTCGATTVGGTVTWAIGDMAVGAVESCSITVEPVGTTCVAITNTATIDGAEGDSVGSNNSSTVSNGGGNAVLDPSFETSLDDDTWTQESANFGTPICDVGGCGTGTGTGPRTGDFWTWLGGLGTGPESGAVEQSVTIQSGITELSFWFESMVCNAANGTADFVRLTVDGDELWRADATSATCGVLGYSEVVIDISAYADDTPHLIRFESETIGAGNPTNFFIDDVLIESFPICNVAAADVSVTLTATPEPALAGGSLTYASDLANNGPLDALDVTWSLPLPAGVTFDSITADPALTCTAPAVDTNGTVECEIALLGASETFAISVATTIDSSVAADFSATATAATSSSENNTANNTATADTTLQDSADLSVTIDDGVPSVLDGDELVYTLVAANAGPETATDAALTASFSANLVDVAWTCTGNGATCPVASGTGNIVALVTLPAGADLTYEIAATVDFSTEDAPTVASASIESPAGLPDGNVSNNTDTDTNGLFSIDIFSDGFED